MSNTLEITRLGHAFWRIETPGGKVVLIDPWVTGNPSLASAWQDGSKYADADYVLVTHGHFDHVNGVVEVMEHAPDAQLIAQFEVVLDFLGKGLENVLPTNVGSTIDLDGIKVSAVSAVHSSSFQNEQTGLLEYRGTPMGYVIEIEAIGEADGGGFKIYAAGDTGLTSDMKFVVGDYFQPDLAILPCDGLLTMSPDQAAYAVGKIGVDHVIPGHDFPSPSDDFPGMAEMIEGFPFVGMMLDKRLVFAERIAARHPEVNAHILAHGESVEIDVG